MSNPEPTARSKTGPVPQPTLLRFERMYIPEPNSGCWLWTGGTTGAGYGIFTMSNRAKRSARSARAHRVSHELFNGPVPPGLVVRHKCDTPLCVNPNHLQVGTQQDNMNDKAARRSAQHTGAC
jgi:hypothetical protein